MIHRLLALAFLCSVPSISYAGKKKGPPEVVDDAAVYGETDRQRAISLLRSALSEKNGNRDKNYIQVALGEHLRLAGEFIDANQEFRAVLDRVDKGPMKASAKLGLVLLDASKGLDEAGISFLQSSDFEQAPATMLADRHMVLAIASKAKGDVKQAKFHTKRALSYAKEDNSVYTRIKRVLNNSESPVETALGGKVVPPIELATAAFEAGNIEEAKAIIAKGIITGKDVEALRALQELINTPVELNRITVLLPLSDRYAAVGKQMQQAIEFGFGDSNAEVVFVDSGATSESAVEALEKAVKEGGSIAVMGPLLSIQTDAVVQSAESLHVPLISLSQSLDDTTDLYWTFQGMFTRGDQIEALVHYVTAELGYTKFGIFYPNNDFGIKASDLFAKQVAVKSGEITSSAPYDAKGANLITDAGNFGKGIASLAVGSKQGAPVASSEGLAITREINFEAIFIPDSASHTPLACAALAYHNFPLGDFRPGFQGPKVPLLGLASWNNKGLVSSGNEYTRSSIFPDVFLADREDPFVVAYKEKNGRTPTSLEAATVDAAALVSNAMQSAPTSRASFRTALLNARTAQSITGANRFDESSHKTNRTMQILTIDKDGINQISTVDLR